MKIEIKHLAPYLPYRVKVSPIHVLHHGNGIGSIGHILTTKSPIYKLHLRPLSGLTKEIKANGERFVPMRWLQNNIHPLISFYESMSNARDLEIDIITDDYSQTIDLYNGYLVMQKLLEWHFDVFGLIDNGLAIDINTLNR